jgi:hypothetical protein
MNWRHKAALQNGIERLPDALGSRLYYLLQRKLGSLRRLNPWSRFEGGLEAVSLLRDQEVSLAGKNVLEIGTGWRVNSPLAFALCGANEVVTVDLNRFLKLELVREDMELLAKDEDRVRRLVGSEFDESRWQSLVELSRQTLSLDELKTRLGISYFAPKDASLMSEYEDGYFACHFSFNVLEHIPKEGLHSIFKEGHRVLSDDGCAVHCIDHSDHFSHSDRSLTSVNFLQYESSVWHKLASPKYMYMNRLRSSDYAGIFESVAWSVAHKETELDDKALELLQSGQFAVASEFTAYEEQELATRTSWYVLRKR